MTPSLTRLLCVILCFAGAPVVSAQAQSDGSLLACGGGALPENVIREFVSRAGGNDGRLVVIPTAGSDGSIDSSATISLWKSRGLGQVSVLHTRNRTEADAEEFVRPLENATAVWFGGGSQSRIAAAYLGTRTEAGVTDVFRRGGIVGGTSAGAAIQSRVMIRSGRQEPEIGTGFDLIPGSIIDQHFLRRNRVNRLLHAVRSHPQRTGIGICEGTGLLVHGGKARVIGRSFVTVVTISAPQRGVSIHVYDPDEEFPLPSDE